MLLPGFTENIIFKYYSASLLRASYSFLAPYPAAKASMMSSEPTGEVPPTGGWPPPPGFEGGGGGVLWACKMTEKQITEKSRNNDFIKVFFMVFRVEVIIMVTLFQFFYLTSLRVTVPLSPLMRSKYTPSFIPETSITVLPVTMFCSSSV